MDILTIELRCIKVVRSEDVHCSLGSKRYFNRGVLVRIKWIGGCSVQWGAGGIEALAKSLHQMDPCWSVLAGTEGDQMANQSKANGC